METGIGPASRLLLKSRSERFFKLEKLSGTVPFRKLLDKSSAIDNVSRKRTSELIIPEVEMLQLRRPRRRDITGKRVVLKSKVEQRWGLSKGGITPDKELLARSIVCRRGGRASEEGIEPENLLLNNCNPLSVGIKPREVGIAPPI
ncbi:elongation factor Tu [Striga asiatica]|uniref:Elongation factor Tu n=1 Tax=Striga asiatica TaxID=4170 RepID=A0A5A7QMQ9_STRAF|nr:elongation factor Tu [Striga asiatica]